MNDLFMEEYINEAYDEMYNYYEELMNEEEKIALMEAKEGVYKDNYYLRDNFKNKYVTPTLAKDNVREGIIDVVAEFMDTHHQQLGAQGPIYTFTFGNNEMNKIYQLINDNIPPSLTPISNELQIKMFDDMVLATYEGGNISKFFKGWVQHAPYKILLIAMMIESLQKGYDDMLECAENMFAYIEYPILYREYWSTGVDAECMIYTIEHLSNKFKVRSMKDLQELLHYDAHVCVINMKERLTIGTDNIYADFMQRIRNQINNKLKNISRAYYDNKDKNLTQHTNTSEFEDGSLADQEGHTSEMTQAIDNTINKFITGTTNNALARVVSERNKLDKNNFINYINQIMNYKGNNVNKLVEDIITAYFNKQPTNTSVGSLEFTNFGLGLYKSIGTSNNPILVEIKNILQFWVYDICEINKSYSSPTTIINYTKSFFEYIIFMIQYYN